MNITLTVMSDDQSYVQHDCQRITVTNIQFPTLGAPRENAHGAHGGIYGAAQRGEID